MTTKTKTPFAQGYEDFFAFGKAANSIQKGEEGFDDYERGKKKAEDRLFSQSKRS